MTSQGGIEVPQRAGQAAKADLCGAARCVEARPPSGGRGRAPARSSWLPTGAGQQWEALAKRTNGALASCVWGRGYQGPGFVWGGKRGALGACACAFIMSGKGRGRCLVWRRRQRLVGIAERSWPGACAEADRPAAISMLPGTGKAPAGVVWCVNKATLTTCLLYVIAPTYPKR